MKQLAHLLRWDFVHLLRNQMIAISLLVTAVYLGIFYLLKPLGYLDSLLIVIIFNDPVIMGYLFAGVLLLFEKDQRTLDALSVVPLSHDAFLWSKALSLSLVATLTALLMVWVGYGWGINYLHFVVAVVGTSALFVWMGCMIGMRANGFNSYLMRSIGVLIPTALPLLALFDVWDSPLLYLVPSFPGILLLKASFQTIEPWQYVYSYLYLPLALAFTYFWCKKLFTAL